MEKMKLTKQSVYEMMQKISQEREKAVEAVARHDGSMNLCKYFIEKFELEEKEVEIVSTNGL